MSLPQTLPAGKYDVTLMSYDNHDDKPFQNQLNESYFVKLYNLAGANTFVSNSLPDLPGNQNTLVASVNSQTLINEASTSISVHHSVSVGANSIRPVCAAFDFVEDEPQLPQLTVVKNLINNNNGTAVVSDFKLFVGGTEVISGATNTFNPGSYAVSETNLPGYMASAWGGDCSTDGNVLLNAGDNKLCTITNNDIYIPPVFPTLSIEKSTNKNVIIAGETVTFTITVNNTGNGSADNLILLDILPGGFTVSDTGNSSIQWNLTSLDPGGSWTESFIASSASNLGNGIYTNTATVSADNYGSISDTASVIIQNPPIILTNPSLSIQKTVTPTVTNAGTTVNYTVVVTNSGNGTAFNTILFDQLPSGNFTYTTTGTSARSWNLGNILPGKSKSTSYVVNIADSVANGTYVNTATVSANNHGVISDTATVQVKGKVLGEEFAPVLLIEKVTDRKRVNPGASVTYTISVTNVGEASAINLKLSDILPEDFSEVDTGKTTLGWSLPLLKEIGRASCRERV